MKYLWDFFIGGTETIDIAMLRDGVSVKVQWRTGINIKKDAHLWGVAKLAEAQ